MPTEVPIFKCPACDEEIAHEYGPNWTPVDPKTEAGTPIVLSCPHCDAALGAYFLPSRQG